jgi:alpha,alpha-trehalase
MNKEQWEQELEYPDQDHSKAHHSGRERTVTNTLHRTGARSQQERKRRYSHDTNSSKAISFLVDVEKTKEQLLAQEDTDKNYQITVEDQGPKLFSLGTFDSDGYRTIEIRGTYQLSNLLQELALASQYGRKTIVLNQDRLNENPLERLSRLIKYHFWDSLTRRMDANGLEKICKDPKAADKQNRVYVPFCDLKGWEYYERVARENPDFKIVVERLPEFITPEYVKSINDKPGILSLGLRNTIDADGQEITRGIPFVVPGGRFNEMYGWDSYFEALGLIQDGRIELARGMVENFWYELEYYDKILNANRSYYLTRSQPPFLTDMMIRTFEVLQLKEGWSGNVGCLWMRTGIRAAVKELLGVWLAKPRLDDVGMCKYHPEGIGIPPETEPSHFNHILEPFAMKYGVDLAEFTKMYQNGSVVEKGLDQYFLHDRAGSDD